MISRKNNYHRGTSILINQNKSQKGFTLIELMVVIAIIGVMSSVVLASLAGARSKARDAKRMGEMRSIEKALSLYALSNNGGLPVSDFNEWNSVPKNGEGSVNCTPGGAVDVNNQALYTVLINGKFLANRPVQDPQWAKGYCHVYISNTIVVAGATYDEQGGLISSGPLAMGAYKVNSAIFGSFVENTKTASGYQALVGVSYGNTLPTSPSLNINLTTGVKIDVDNIVSSPFELSGGCLTGNGSGDGSGSIYNGTWYSFCSQGGSGY